MKKAFGALLVFLVLFAFTGCAADGGSAALSGPSASPDAASQAASSAAGTGQSESKQPENVSGSSFSDDQTPGIQAKVVDVVDGDTIKAVYRGKETTIRILLIDTPETHHPRLGAQPYGQEASSYAHELLDGKTVHLEPAVNEERDKYDRLLAYVFVDGKSFEELMLAQGLARVAYVIPPNTKYIDRYRAVEADAKGKRLGIWSIDGYARDDGYHEEVVDGESEAAKKEQGKNEDNSSSAQFAADANGNCGGAIKGNISDRGKIYHMPSGSYYGVTKAEICFKTKEAARAAGFRASRE